MVLRDYQQTALERALLIAEAGGRPLIVAPTGAGKGTIIAAMAQRYAAEGRRVLVISHRIEIAKDLGERMGRHGRSATVQGELSRAEGCAADVLIVDEAHHYYAPSFRAFVESHEGADVIGATATPQRGDGKPLGDVFTDLLVAVTYSELLKRGVLVPCRTLRPESRLGRDLAQYPEDAYLRYAQGRPAFVFDRGLQEAQRTTAALKAAGVHAEYIDHETRKRERERIVRGHKSGDVDVIVNVGTMTEGVDVPRASCVVLARPCSYPGMYLQMVGRSLRACPGKSDAMLIDLVGASYAHGLPGTDAVYSLDGSAPISLGMGRETFTPEDISQASDARVLDLDLVEVGAGEQDEIARIAARARKGAAWAKKARELRDAMGVGRA